MTLKHVLRDLSRSSCTQPLTEDQMNLLLAEADEQQLYVAVITSQPTQEQHDRLEARWTELRAARGAK